MFLDSTTKKFDIVLAGSAGAPEAQHQVTADYAVIDQTTRVVESIVSVNVVTNDTTGVDVIPAPASGKAHKVLRVSVQNYGASTANSQTFEFRLRVGAGITVVARLRILLFEMAQYNDGEGWRCFSQLGELKTGGVPGSKHVSFLMDAAAVVWTNMPAANTFFNGSHRYVTKADLSGFSQCRLIVNKQTVAGAAAAVLRLQYKSGSFSTTVGSYLQIGASSVEVAINTTDTVLVSSWINLVDGAKADVHLAINGVGGDGALDPQFGVIAAEFR